MKLIQVLPINDTTATHTWKDSYPYAAISVFALHPLFLHLPALAGRHHQLLNKYEAKRLALNALEKVDYEAVLAAKWAFIKEIYPLIKDETFAEPAFQDFFEQNKNWLKSYACYCYLRDKYQSPNFEEVWNEKSYSDELAENLINTDADGINIHYFVQYHLHKQLQDAVNFAHRHKVVLKGDIAIGVYRYSVDVWQNAPLFHTDLQAGAPPDDFAINGQNWKLPTYNWQQMKETGYAWWKQRLSHMSQYFDAIRIDHILGFFRIWSIPTTAIDGILGYFAPAIPVYRDELRRAGVNFLMERLYLPFVHYNILKETFADDFSSVAATFFDEQKDGVYHFKPAFDTQIKLANYFSRQENNTHNKWLHQCLSDLIANVVLIPADDAGNTFHFRFNMHGTTSFQYLPNAVKSGLMYLYNDYFFRRQNALWKREAEDKLPAVKYASNMLVCGEDLGFTPDSVPEVMEQLGILRLFIQRMPKDPGSGCEDLFSVPYLSVVSSSTHDTGSIRGWWQQLSRHSAEDYFHFGLHQYGIAPAQNDCPDWLNRMIVEQHLQSSAMWSIFLLQDLLNIRYEHRCENAADEQINHPENPNQYWQYRMPLSLEELYDWAELNKDLKEMIRHYGR